MNKFSINNFNYIKLNKLFFYSNEKELIAKYLKEQISSFNSKKILEIGAGEFPIITQLPEANIDKTIVEPYKNTPYSDDVRFIRKPFSLELLKGETFDAVIAVHTISYFKNKEKFINDILELLEPGGVCFLVMHKNSCPQIKLMNEIRNKLGYSKIDLINSDDLFEILDSKEILYSSRNLISHWEIPTEVVLNNTSFFFHFPKITVIERRKIKKILYNKYLNIKTHNEVVAFSKEYFYSSKSEKQYWNLSHSRKPNKDYFPFYKDVIKTYKRLNLGSFTDVDLLDLCCGKGFETLNFSKKCNTSLGVDISQVAIEVANNLNQNTDNIRFICADIVDYIFSKEDKYNVVFSKLGLHYFNIDVTAKIFKRLHQILEKNGLLYFIVRSVDDPSYNQGKEIEEGYFLNAKDFRHRRLFFSKDLLFNLLKDIGFSNITISNRTVDYFDYSGNVLLVSCVKI